ncbi:hypothetical protein BH09MYX1_BH09MYX1_11470 [soil metagenome]
MPSGQTVSGAAIVTTNDPLHPTFRIPLTATSRGAELHFEPTGFGDIPVTGSSPAVPILLQNTGNAPVDVEIGKPSRGDFIVVSGSAHLEPDAKALPTMRFSPSTSGVINGTVPLVVKGPLCGVKQDVALSGKGTKGVVLTSPGSVDFGLVDCGSTGDARKVTVANTGDAPFDFGAKLGNVLYAVSPTSGTVKPAESVELTVTPNPIPSTSAVIPDLYGGSLTITSTAPGDFPHIVDLHQTAHGAILTMTQSALDAGSRVVDDVITVPMGTIANSGNATVTVNGAGTGGIGMVPSAVPAGGSTAAAAAFALDPTVHRLGLPVTESLALATNAAPLCAPVPLITITVRPVERAIDLDSSGNEGTLCAVGHTHRAYCMGSNLYGEIRPGPPYLYEPLTVVTNVGADVVGVAQGSTCFAQGATMTCRTLGWQNDGNTPFPPPWTTTFPASVTRIRGQFQPAQIAGGYGASYLVLLANGTVYGVGESAYGKFGVPNPQSLVGSGPFLAMGGLNDVVDVGIGLHHACIVRAGGAVACAGYGLDGEIVPGQSMSSDLPVTVAGLSATRVALMDRRTCALRANGTVACWGRSWTPPYDALSPIADVPFSLAINRTSIAASRGNVAALRAQGNIDGFAEDAVQPYSHAVAAGSLLRPGLVVNSPTPIHHALCALEPSGMVRCFGGTDAPAYLAGFD